MNNIKHIFFASDLAQLNILTTRHTVYMLRVIVYVHIRNVIYIFPVKCVLKLRERDKKCITRELNPNYLYFRCKNLSFELETSTTDRTQTYMGNDVISKFPLFYFFSLCFSESMLLSFNTYCKSSEANINISRIMWVVQFIFYYSQSIFNFRLIYTFSVCTSSEYTVTYILGYAYVLFQLYTLLSIKLSKRFIYG